MAFWKSIKIIDVLTNIGKGLIFRGDAPEVCTNHKGTAIAKGDVSGNIPFSKTGRTSNVATTLVDIWSGNSEYVFPVIAQQMNIISNSPQDKGTPTVGTGIQKILIIGLDTNYAEIQEQVTLDGTSTVTTTNSFFRINYCIALQVGSTGKAVGTISVQNIAGSVIYSRIQNGSTACSEGIFTVPAGKTLYVNNIRVSGGEGGATLKNSFLIFTPKANNINGTLLDFFLPFSEIGIFNGSLNIPLEIPKKVLEKTDLKMSVVGDYASGSAVVTSYIAGWLEDN